MPLDETKKVMINVTLKGFVKRSVILSHENFSINQISYKLFIVTLSLMEEKTADYSSQQMSSSDLLKKKIFDYVFHLCNLATSKETEIADYTYETGFVRGVKLAKSLMWKHMMPEVKKAIESIYEKMEADINAISKVLNEDQKKLEKQMIADDASMQVLEILLVVLMYSSMSVEMKEIEIKDWDKLIQKARSDVPVKIFERVINEKEEQ